jgi:hypothetical protein
MKNFFSKLFAKIKSIFKFTKDNEKRIDELGLKIVSTIDVALPIVKAITQFSGVTNLDKVFEEISKWNAQAGNVLNNPEGNIVGGIKLGLAATQLREQLIKLLLQYPLGIKFGSIVLRTPEDVARISDSDLRVIAEFAYSILKAAEAEEQGKKG